MGHLSDHVRRRVRAHLDAMPARPTQAAIGRAVHRTQTWVSHYLSGRHDIDLDTLSKLCEFLQVDLPSLLQDEHTRATLAPPYDEALTMLRALAQDERDTMIDVLRVLVRRPTAKRARR